MARNMKDAGAGAPMGTTGGGAGIYDPRKKGYDKVKGYWKQVQSDLNKRGSKKNLPKITQ